MAHASVGIVLLTIAGAGYLHAQAMPPGSNPSKSSVSTVSDSMPPSCDDLAYVITDPGGRPGQFLRNVAVVHFKDGTSAAQVQAAVRLVHGLGVSHFDAIDAYYIRLPEHGIPLSADSLDRVLQRLEAVPQVDRADVDDCSPKQLE